MFRIPTVTRNLLILNTLAFIAAYLFGHVGGNADAPYVLNEILGLHFFLAPDFHVYQIFTYMFMHGNITHIFFNMFALWMFGCVVENVWGPKKFLFFYLVCGLGAGFTQELVQLVQFYVKVSDHIPNVSIHMLGLIASNSGEALNTWTTVGASGAIYGILLAFGLIFPEERIFIFPLPIPIKAKWFVLIYVGVELFSAFGTSGDGVAHFAHLGGMLFGYFLIRYWRGHPYSSANYGMGKGRQFFDGLRNGWERHSHKKTENTFTRSDGSYNGHESDWEYNAQKKARQEKVDAILDKIRKSGYDSLTKEEKQALFDASNDK